MRKRGHLGQRLLKKTAHIPRPHKKWLRITRRFSNTYKKTTILDRMRKRRKTIMQYGYWYATYFFFRSIRLTCTSVLAVLSGPGPLHGQRRLYVAGCFDVITCLSNQDMQVTGDFRRPDHQSVGSHISTPSRPALCTIRRRCIHIQFQTSDARPCSACIPFPQHRCHAFGLGSCRILVVRHHHGQP